jgi:Mg2+ and Co2+ transporter CorA
MLNKPAVDLIDELHWLGRQLAVLKRLYQSYELIMTRLLQRQRLLQDEARENHQRTPFGHTFDLEIYRQMTESFSASTPETSVGVRLSPPAVARFERLLDRIKLYCLSEIDSCLAEKESLTFLNFNLIALKDSQAVEKLTRITILLAKVTILFLPVSLMTGYFSTELAGVKGVYTQVQYWVAFAVIIVLSIVLLALFGWISDTVEGKPIYRSMFRTFFRKSKSKLLEREET